MGRGSPFNEWARQAQPPRAPRLRASLPGRCGGGSQAPVLWLCGGHHACGGPERAMFKVMGHLCLWETHKPRAEGPRACAHVAQELRAWQGRRGPAQQGEGTEAAGVADACRSAGRGCLWGLGHTQQGSCRPSGAAEHRAGSLGADKCLLTATSSLCVSLSCPQQGLQEGPGTPAGHLPCQSVLEQGRPRKTGQGPPDAPARAPVQASPGHSDTSLTPRKGTAPHLVRSPQPTPLKKSSDFNQAQQTGAAGVGAGPPRQPQPPPSPPASRRLGRGHASLHSHPGKGRASSSSSHRLTHRHTQGRKKGPDPSQGHSLTRSSSGGGGSLRLHLHSASPAGCAGRAVSDVAPAARKALLPWRPQSSSRALEQAGSPAGQLAPCPGAPGTRCTPSCLPQASGRKGAELCSGGGHLGSPESPPSVPSGGAAASEELASSPGRGGKKDA